MKFPFPANLKFLIVFMLLLSAIDLKAKWNSLYDNKGNVKPISEWGNKKLPAIIKEQDQPKKNAYDSPIIKSSTVAYSPKNSVIAIPSVADGKEVFYYETISNPTKTTNFLIGIYPYMYTYDASLNDNKGASVIKLGIKNNATSDYSWKDYRVIIQLSTGETYTNYTTSSTEGKYSCNYVIPPNGTHHQSLTFHKQFDYKKIIKVFVLIDSTIFDLQSGS